MPLTDVECRKAKCPEGRSYIRLSDSGGLYLEVTQPGVRNPQGAKLWRWKYRFDGKEKRLALGVYPQVSLAQARAAHAQARATLAQGKDPSEERKAAKVRDSCFELVARQWWDVWRVDKTERYAGYVLHRLELDAFPLVGQIAVTELTAPHFVRMAVKIEGRGAGEIARRVMETCGQIMRWAVAHGLAERNPVADVKPGDVLRPRQVVNFARVDLVELPDLLRLMNAYQGTPSTRAALRLLALTFVRTSELILARWGEFDLVGLEWTIPADRIGRKGRIGERRPHIVPLAPQVVEVLETLRLARGGLERCGPDVLLFPGDRKPDQPMSNNTILQALKRMGYQGRQTGHGFRGIASTALNEMGFRPDVIEAQLSHIEGNRVRAAYNHAQYLDERRELMRLWADYLDAVQRTGKAIPFRQAVQLLRPSAS